MALVAARARLRPARLAARTAPAADGRKDRRLRAVIDHSALGRGAGGGVRRARRTLSAPSARDGLDLSTAYAVERSSCGLRRAAGHATVGVKVGFANKAMWRVLKLDTLVWAHMYDDTVRYANANAPRSRSRRRSRPKIEPEIVFKLKAPLSAGITEAAAALEAVEWLALGFEIIDCPFADWKFQPADFVAAYGLHAALIVGEPRPVTAAIISEHSSSSCRPSRCGSQRTASWSRRVGPQLASQSGAVSRRARVGDRRSRMHRAAGRGRSHQLRHADRIDADPAWRHMDRVGRGHRVVRPRR